MFALILFELLSLIVHVHLYFLLTVLTGCTKKTNAQTNDSYEPVSQSDDSLTHKLAVWFSATNTLLNELTESIGAVTESSSDSLNERQVVSKRSKFYVLQHHY